jgi:ribosomal protein S12 methylthiotransferase
MAVPKINVVTLGCPKNEVDTEVLLAQLKANRASIVQDGSEAEVAVINTCGFIEAAKRESIDAITEALHAKKEGRFKKVVVMGCLAQRYQKELLEELPEIDAIFGANQVAEVVRGLGLDLKRELLGERLLTTPPHLAYLKISEGCDRPCSFCAIPLMRGTHRSRPLEDVIREASALAGKGVREIVLIAQDTTSYGLDLYGRRRLADLLEGLSGIEDIRWIRLMYAYPAGFPREILQVFQSRPSLCRYLDLPLQHISDPVLRSMRRGITADATRRLLDDIQTAVPEIALRTTFIVGYPAESEQDFRLLHDFVNERKFHRLGVFAYSQESGTAADSLGDPVPPEVKQERRDALMELQQRISEERNSSLVGSTVKVLIDRIEDGVAVGRTEWDAPEIDQEVHISPADGVQLGTFCDVRVTDAVEYDLFGEVSRNGGEGAQP